MKTEGLIRQLEKQNISFIRTRDQLMFFNEKKSGLQLTAREAVEIFGADIINDVMDDGSAIIVCHNNEPATTFKNRREYLGLSRHDVMVAAEVKFSDVEDAETNKSTIDINVLVKIAKALGLDPRYISFKRGNPANGYLYE